MKERPILFSAPMIRAILEGRKTQTRRIVKLPAAPDRLGAWEPTTIGGPGLVDSQGREHPVEAAMWHTRTGTTIACPYGAPSDWLWVRETHAQFSVGEGMNTPVPQCVAYRATCAGDAFDYVNSRGEIANLTVTKWTPSIFMPRWASRITLEVADVRVERLHDITEEDAKAEGVAPALPVDDIRWRPAFERLWRDINGAESWDANPWVWVVEFRRLEAQERAA